MAAPASPLSTTTAARLIQLIAGLGLLGFPLLATGAFAPGDLSWAEGLALHGATIPAWMLLVLALRRDLGASWGERFAGRWLPLVAALAAALAVIGEGLALLVPWAAPWVIAPAMLLAELVGLAGLAWAIPRRGAGTLARLGLVLALVAMSIATPLGHLAAALHDLPGLTALSASAAGAEEVAGAHGHQVVAAFLAAILLLPLSSRVSPPAWALPGVGLVLLGTVAQAAIYQVCAFSGWEPPTLFAAGPDGMPLDDVVLALLGVGLLLGPLPVLVTGRTQGGRWRGRILALGGAAFLVVVVGLGVFIEFHEGWFGGGDPGSGAPGVGADLAYTRGHILFGALLLPLLLAQALHVAPRVAGLVGVALLTAGVGVFAWTFLGSPVLLGIGVGVGVSGLFVGASRRTRGGERAVAP